jgi:hypothetical protein
LAPTLRHHAWFVGWAPLDEPELVVAVIVEHGGDGGSAAAPVAAEVIKEALGWSSGTEEGSPLSLAERSDDRPVPTRNQAHPR